MSTKPVAPPASGRGRTLYQRRNWADHAAGDARQVIWASMRVLLTFTVSQLETVTEFSADRIREYLRQLARAGYVRALAKSSGVREAVWRLVKNTGPKAPRASLRNGLTDLNTGQTFDKEGNPVSTPRRSVYQGQGGRARARKDGTARP